jgi:hypothetical protein
VVTTWAVLFAFTAIAVPGHGLHLLPGLDHGHGEAEGYSSKIGQSAQNPGHQVSYEPAHESSCDHEDDCPICHFLALGKTSPHLPVSFSFNATVSYLATTDLAPFSGHCELPFFARGPPEV